LSRSKQNKAYRTQEQTDLIRRNWDLHDS